MKNIRFIREICGHIFCKESSFTRSDFETVAAIWIGG